MKQIGPNTFIGADPYLCMMAAELVIESNRREADRERKFRQLSPADKFLYLLNKRTQKPKRMGVSVDHTYFRFGQNTLISLFKTDKLSGVPDCNRFMCHVESIYIVDSARGLGLGRECVDMLTGIAEETGCVLELFCNPFVWSYDGISAYAFESFDQLWGVVCDEKWEILYHRDYQKELTKFFYQQAGFTNMCLYDEWVYARDKEEDLPFDQQFAYVPKTLSSEYRQQISRRLNYGECEFCNRV